MNILYLNHYAGSPALGMEYRPYYLAREWVRLGHRVRIVAATYSHVRTRQPQTGMQTVDGIEYEWIDAPPYQGNGLGRVWNIWTFLRQVWARAEALVREVQPHIVIASSTYPMDIWVARRLARKAGAKLVFEVHDLWPLSPIELSGMSRRHPFILLCQWAEDTAYRVADVVVSMLPAVHDHMASRGLDLRKLAIVPNGIALDEWTTAAQPLRDDVAAAIERARAAGECVVGYAGSHGLPNALDTLLDAAALLAGEETHRTPLGLSLSKPGKGTASPSTSSGRTEALGVHVARGTEPKLHIVMVGDGHEKPRLQARVRDEGLHNVTMLPPIPKAQIPSFLAATDIAYIGWQRVPIYRFGIAPNKLMDYMMAGCAVLHSVQAGNDPVAEAGCGLTVPPEDAQAVAQGLRQLAARTPDERRAMGERGRAFVQAHHTYPVLAQHFLDACTTPSPWQGGGGGNSQSNALHRRSGSAMQGRAFGRDGGAAAPMHTL
jgi:glycosyltransferase involved in cell wall biosynthesis